MILSLGWYWTVPSRFTGLGLLAVAPADGRSGIDIEEAFEEAFEGSWGREEARAKRGSRYCMAFATSEAMPGGGAAPSGN